MCRFAIVLLGLTGCFYVDPINQRPAIDIRQTSSTEVYRGSVVRLLGIANDPEDHIVFFQWRAYACTDANEVASCDSVPFYTEVLDSAVFTVGSVRVDEPVPVESVLVILEAEDGYGAIARPRQELIIPVADHAPVLELTASTRFGYVVNMPLELYAKVADFDDGPASVLPLEWTIFSPMDQPTYEVVDIDVDDPEPMTSLQLGKRLTPHGVGRWEVQVTATDPLGVATTKTVMLDIVDDRPPCLAQWSPIAAPSGSTLPLSEATLFQVPVVTDDLDRYPTVPGDALLGTTAFAWSIKQPGSATRTPLPTTGNGVVIDPGNYEPGDIVELRVEIADRNATPVNCADDQATCSVISDDACIQRQTWRVEVR